MHGRTLVITLDRPSALNALNWEAIWRLGDLCAQAGPDDDVAAIVITGAGSAFSAGGDINDQKTRADWPLAQHVTSAERLLGAVRAIFECSKPVVAAINGVAAGGGAGLALLCDYRIAAQGARVGFAYPRIGLGPDFGVSWTLPRIVGPGQAARLLFTAEYVDADEALRIGLADEVTQAGALDFWPIYLWAVPAARLAAVRRWLGIS